jgi:hypothetical protein
MKINSFLTRQSLSQPHRNPPTGPVSLDNLRVASPCPATWESMTGDSRVRHCQECKLNVYNISEMTRSEAERLIASREGRLCVRFYRRADGTILTRDCPRGLQVLIRRVSRVAGAALSAMMTVGAAFGQTSAQPNPQKTNSQATPKPAQLALTVVDPQGAILQGARVLLLDERSKTKVVIVTDSVGAVSVSANPGPYVLRVELPGFKANRQTIALTSSTTTTLQVRLQVTGEQTVGVAIVGGTSMIERDSATVKTVFSGDLLDHMPLR